jgi:hypothetical protein
MSTRNDERARYEAWYARCDRVCLSVAGVGIDDLGDGPSWDSWASGMSPSEYVGERLAEEGFPFDD